ncbi:MAG: PA domain-containing protein [Chitinophagaceae bacterium]|jgi:hypothetical protein
MKGKNLLKIVALSAASLFGAGAANAQEPLKESIGGNLGSTRFVVTQPTAIIGIKKINFATWGKAASPAMYNIPVEKAYDTLGAAALLNGTGTYPSLAGKFAIIFRGGGVTFVDKAKRCKDKGAIGVIIVNNAPGDPVGMGAPTGYTESIPVLMVSDIDGIAINNAIKAVSSPSDTVKVTLGGWNLGSTHDLGILSRFVSLPSALNIPISQMTGSTGTVYNNHYIGGAVANYGTATETGVVVTDSVYWTPKSGSRSFVTANSFTIPSIAPLDSVKFGFGTPYTIAAPTVAGKYEHVYSIAYGNTDAYPQDNIYTLNQFVTDSVYSKVPLDPTTGHIISTSGYGPLNTGTGSTDIAVVGSMMYVNKADLTNNKYTQFSLSIKDVGTLKGTTVYTHLLKWTDTAGGVADSFVQASELNAIGISATELKEADSSGDVITARLMSVTDPSDPTLKVALEPNSWYAVVVEVPASYYLGYNENVSTFTRAYSQFVAGGSVPGSPIRERDEIARFTEDLITVLGTPTNFFVNYPFGATAGSTPPTNNFFVDSIFYDKYNKVPSIALITTPNELKLSIEENIKQYTKGSMNVYPVPASNTATVTLNFENLEKNVEIRVFDAMGRTVYAEKRNNVKTDKFDIDLSRVASGTYHIVASTGNGLLSTPIVVIK